MTLLIILSAYITAGLATGTAMYLYLEADDRKSERKYEFARPEDHSVTNSMMAAGAALLCPVVGPLILIAFIIRRLAVKAVSK